MEDTERLVLPSPRCGHEHGRGQFQPHLPTSLKYSARADVARNIIWIPLSSRNKITIHCLDSSFFVFYRLLYDHHYPLLLPLSSLVQTPSRQSVEMRSAASSLLFGALSSLLAVAQAVGDEPATSAAQYFVRSLPGQPEGPLVKMHAGCVFPFFSTSTASLPGHYKF